jgi:hypothetical protein
LKDISSLLQEIEKLSSEEKVSVYNYIQSKLTKKEQLIASLEKFKGIGKGIWDEDAQEYINRLRADDRF